MGWGGGLRGSSSLPWALLQGSNSFSQSFQLFSNKVSWSNVISFHLFTLCLLRIKNSQFLYAGESQMQFSVTLRKLLSTVPIASYLLSASTYKKHVCAWPDFTHSCTVPCASSWAKPMESSTGDTGWIGYGLSWRNLESGQGETWFMQIALSRLGCIRSSPITVSFLSREELLIWLGRILDANCAKSKNKRMRNAQIFPWTSCSSSIQ